MLLPDTCAVVVVAVVIIIIIVVVVVVVVIVVVVVVVAVVVADIVVVQVVHLQQYRVVQPGVRGHGALVAALAVRGSAFSPVGQVGGLRLAPESTQRQISPKLVHSNLPLPKNN